VRFISWGVIPLGSLGAGLAAASIGIRPALWLFSLMGLAGPLFFWLSPVRRLRELGDLEPERAQAIPDPDRPAMQPS
jgi:hypothetical protein